MHCPWTRKHQRKRGWQSSDDALVVCLLLVGCLAAGLEHTRPVSKLGQPQQACMSGGFVRRLLAFVGQRTLFPCLGVGAGWSPKWSVCMACGGFVVATCVECVNWG